MDLKDNGPTQRYEYDLNGNLQRVYVDGGIGGRTDRKLLNYDPYNKPLLIDDKVSGRRLEFAYGSNDQRFIQLKDLIGDYTVYIDKLFEAEGSSGTPNTDLEAKLYIGDYAVYDLTLTNNAEGPARAELNYLHRDRLGSVVAMSNSQGAVINMTGRGFDAFGKPREEGWQDSDHMNGADANSGASEPGDLNRNDLSTRGFTGHEHLNETDLIHMNGRVYDYNLGRFLSVDPFIQFPANSQSMNAYSYLMNNPLSGTDPSGYQSNSDVEMSSTGATTGGSSAMDQAKESKGGKIVEVTLKHERGRTGCLACKGEVKGGTVKYGDGSTINFGVKNGQFSGINGVSLSPTIGSSKKGDQMSQTGDVSDRSQTKQEELFGLPDLDASTMVAANNVSSTSTTAPVAGTTPPVAAAKNNLVVIGSAKFVKLVAEVEQRAVKAGLTIFDDLRNGPIKIIIRETRGPNIFSEGFDSSGNLNSGVIDWNVKSAALVLVSSVGREKERYQSAALGLIHELGHAEQFSLLGMRGKQPETDIVTKGTEYKWAVYYGEPQRHPTRAHGGRVKNDVNNVFWFTRR